MQAVLGLSGAVEIATAGVSKYVEAFNNFAFLWQRDLASEYAKFVATHPTREVGERLVLADMFSPERCHLM